MNARFILPSAGPAHLLRRTGLALLLVAFPAGEALCQVGATGMAFLKLGTDARSAALSGATIAIASGAAATTQNPAGLAIAPDPWTSVDVLFTHREWIQDTRIEYLGVRVALDSSQAIGVSLSSLSTGDIEIRERPGPAQGTFAARNAAIGLSYARGFGALELGLTVKLLYEKILVDDATGFAVDIGGRWESSLPGLLVGAAIQHLGGMGALRDKATVLPMTLRAGPAYGIRWEQPRADVLIAGDVAYIPEEGEAYASLAGEFTYDRMASARVGYQFGSSGRGFSAGAGFRYGLFLLDYAYAPVASDLGNTHTISVGLTF
jgi:hypothetical protein